MCQEEIILLTQQLTLLLCCKIYEFLDTFISKLRFSANFHSRVAQVKLCTCLIIA